MLSPSFYANRILDKLQIDQVSDLYRLEEIAWARGALIVERKLTGAEARLSTLGESAVISVSASTMNPHRKRFAAAHELGHYEMRHKRRTVGCTAEDLNQWTQGSKRKKIEYASNQFAAELLLPRRFVTSYCVTETPCLDDVSEIARIFRTSLTATAIRYAELGEDCVAIVFSRAGHIEWFHSSPDFRGLGLFVPVGECPSIGTIADRLFEGEVVSREPQRVKASAWLVSREMRISDNATLVEQSWEISSYNAILTLLHIDEELEDNLWIW